MLDRRTKLAEFRAAVRNCSRDPYALKRVLDLPPLAESRDGPYMRGGGRQQQSSEIFQENGTDWTNVLTAWLDAWEALEAVS